MARERRGGIVKVVVSQEDDFDDTASFDSMANSEISFGRRMGVVQPKKAVVLANMDEDIIEQPQVVQSFEALFDEGIATATPKAVKVYLLSSAD